MRKWTSLAVMVLSLFAFSGLAYSSDSNGLAIGVEKVTKAPFTAVVNGGDHLFTPVKEVTKRTFDAGDHVRAAIVSVGLNFGKPVEE